MRKLKTVFALLCLCLVWQLLHVLAGGIGIPSIFATLEALVRNFPTLMQHLSVSAYRLFLALFSAFVIGCLIGFAMAKFQSLDELLSPIIYLITPIPKVAFLPIVMVIVGIHERARILVLVLIVVFQFIVGPRDALKAMPRGMAISVQSLNLKRRTEIIDVIIPYCAPYLFSSLRAGFGMSIAVLFFIETFVNQMGIGYYIMNRWGMVNYTDMFAGILVLSLFGFLVYRVLDGVERKICRWRFLSKP